MAAAMDFSSIFEFRRALSCCCTVTYSPFSPRNLLTPIRRSDFRPYMDLFFGRAFGWNFSMRLFYGLPIELSELPAANDEGIARLEAINATPVELMPYLPKSLYEEPLRDFLLGLIPAYHAAQEIHNRAALWLVE
jgi:hypothetical protein